MATSGNLRLSVIEAKLTRDTDWFSKMDPWCEIQTRHQKVRTRTLNNAGKTPKWDQVFDIDVKYIGDDMVVTVYDEDTMSSDLVGKTTIKMSSLCINGGLDDWFPIQYKGKQCGQVHLRGDWKPAQVKPAGFAGGSMAAAMGQQLGMQVQMGHAQYVMGQGIAQPMMAPQMMMNYQQPMMMQPGMMQPGMMQPGMMPMQQQPVMGMQQPVMGMQQQPVMGMQQPMMQQPMMQPGMQQPMMQQPMMQPGMQQPMMQQPGMMQSQVQRPPQMQQQLPPGGYTYNQY